VPRDEKRHKNEKKSIQVIQIIEATKAFDVTLLDMIFNSSLDASLISRNEIFHTSISGT